MEARVNRISKVITRSYIKDFFHLDNSERDEALLKLVLKHLIPRDYAPGSYICNLGDKPDSMYFIESGSVIIRGKNQEVNDVLLEGQYFGEYAAITGDNHFSDAQAKDSVCVYRLDKRVLLYLTRVHPGIYGLFLKNTYEASSKKYQKLVKQLQAKRNPGSGTGRKRLTLPAMFINYTIVVLIFLAALFFSSNQAYGPIHPIWLCTPLIFMVGYIIITKRILEALVLATMYSMILFTKQNFIGAFAGHLVTTINDTSDIIVLVLLMGSMSRLFTASGSINALKYVIQRRIRSGGSTLFISFLTMIVVSLDEYLSIMINGICFTPVVDTKRVPREKSSMIMGITPGAICILNPISITGIYIAGVILMSAKRGGLFIESIQYNFGAFITIFFILLLIIGKLPLFGGLKKAAERVKNGGLLWPEGTDIVDEQDEKQFHGRLSNLILPVLVLIASSIITGTLEAGTFQVNVLYGMCITLIFSFVLYCFQQYMTPDQFFKNVIFGIENMIAPIVVFVVGRCFANSMELMGFSDWLGVFVHDLIGGQAWLLPAIIFIVYALIGALFDNPWAMYAIGIPVAVSFALKNNGSIALYIGAVCSAGLLGNELAPGDIFFIGPILGINPINYYRTKLPYIIVITIITLAAFVAAGYMSSKGWEPIKLLSGYLFH